MHAHVQNRFSHVWLFVILWTIACQALLSIGFSRQEYWGRLPFPSPGDLPNPGIEPSSLMSSVLAGRVLPLPPHGQPPFSHPHLTVSVIDVVMYTFVYLYPIIHYCSDGYFNTFFLTFKLELWFTCYYYNIRKSDFIYLSLPKTFTHSFFSNFIYLFIIYFWLCWVFIAVWAFL